MLAWCCLRDMAPNSGALVHMSNLTGRKPTPLIGNEPRRECSATKAARTEWKRKFHYCWHCGNTFNLAVHHMVDGSVRYDEPWNWAIICDGLGGCHYKIHNAIEFSEVEWFVLFAAYKIRLDRPHSDTKTLLMYR